MNQQAALAEKIQILFEEYESLLGAESIVQAVHVALWRESLRCEDNGIYTRAAKYAAAAEVLK